MTFEQYQAESARLEAAYKASSLVMRQWDSERLPNGLTPDRIKALQAWQVAKAANAKAFQAMQEFNRQWSGKFKKQIRAAIDAKRAATLAERATI